MPILTDADAWLYASACGVAFALACAVMALAVMTLAEAFE